MPRFWCFSPRPPGGVFHLGDERSGFHHDGVRLPPTCCFAFSLAGKLPGGHCVCKPTPSPTVSPDLPSTLSGPCAPFSSPFFSALAPSSHVPVGPVGLLFPSTMSPLNWFLLYKHWGTTIRQHSPSSHAQDGRHSFTPLRRSYYLFIMLGPIRRTPSYKAGILSVSNPGNGA